MRVSPLRGNARRRLAAVVLATLVITSASSTGSEEFDPAPEFPSQDPREWIGPPQSLKALAGKVVLLDVWTFG